MQSEELKRKSIAFDDMSPDESIGTFSGSGQWVELCTVRDLRALEAALSAEPQPAPSVAVKADLPERFEEWWTGRDNKGEKTLDYNQRKQLAWDAFHAAALSAQVQDVAGWQDISTLEPKDGMIVMGWGEYRERDGFSPAFMRWYDSVGGWNVSAMPFYPTHWMPLPAAPAKQEG